MQSSNTPSSAITAASSNQAESFPLYKDVLQSVLQFLDTKELHSVVQVCHQWYDLVRTMHPLALSLTKKHLDAIPFGSALARHVAVATKLEFITRKKPGFIRNLASIFPNLTKVNAYTDDEVLKEDGEMSSKLVLPSKLEELDLGCFVFHSLRFHTRLFEVLIPLSQLQKIGICFHGRHARIKDFDFSCLIGVQFPHLKTFRFQYVDFAMKEVPVDSEDHVLSASFIRFLRQLSINFLFLYAEFKGAGLHFSRLVDQVTADASPCPLLQSLTSIDMTRGVIIDSAVLQSLSRIPQLKTLTISGNRIEPPQMSQLYLLRNLEHLILDRDENSGFQNFPEETVQICKGCPQIRRLTLENLETLDSEQFDACLSFLPNLTHLEIKLCIALTSMEGLSKYGLPQRLKQLDLTQIAIPESDVVQFILPLQQLQHLFISTPDAGQYSETLRAQLKVESATCAFHHLIDSRVSSIL